MRYIILGLMVIIGGCVKQPTIKIRRGAVKHRKRKACTRIGVLGGRWANVAVYKGCTGNITTVVVMFKEGATQAAAAEVTHFLTRLLGYTPRLVLLAIKTGKTRLYIYGVVGRVQTFAPQRKFAVF